MKKILLSLALLGAMATSSFGASRTNSRVLFDWGTFKVCVPLRTIDAVGFWDFVGKRSLVGAETPVAIFNKLQLVAGGASTLEGQGTPFVGIQLRILNPTETFVPLSSFNPGIFAGRNFRENSWIFGLRASVGLF